MQPSCDLLQIRFLALEHWPEQLSHALAEAAGAGAELQFSFAKLKKLAPGARAVFRVTERQRRLIQPQLIVLRCELDGFSKKRFVTRGVVGALKLDLYRNRSERLAHDRTKLRNPARQYCVYDKLVVAVVWADRIEPEPGTGRILMKP